MVSPSRGRISDAAAAWYLLISVLVLVGRDSTITAESLVKMNFSLL